MDYYDLVGLINNPDNEDKNSHKKLSYYTYKKMTEKLEGADWATLATLHDGTDDDYLYLFSVEKAGRPVTIAWWDYFDEPGYSPGDTKPITLTGLSGTAVTVTNIVPHYDSGVQVIDYASAFAVTTYPVSNGSVTILLGEDPLLVEVEGERVYLPLVSNTMP